MFLAKCHWMKSLKLLFVYTNLHYPKKLNWACKVNKNVLSAKHSGLFGEKMYREGCGTPYICWKIMHGTQSESWERWRNVSISSINLQSLSLSLISVGHYQLNTAKLQVRDTQKRSKGDFEKYKKSISCNDMISQTPAINLIHLNIKRGCDTESLFSF